MLAFESLNKRLLITSKYVYLRNKHLYIICRQSQRTFCVYLKNTFTNFKANKNLYYQRHIIFTCNNSFVYRRCTEIVKNRIFNLHQQFDRYLRDGAVSSFQIKI